MGAECKIQVITCKCGAQFAACAVPECYTENDWLKSLRKYVQQGCSVDIIDSGTLTLEKCKCKKDNNQLTIKI